MFTPEELKAKKLLLTMFFINICTHGALIYTQKYSSEIFPIFLTGLLMYFIMQGHKWAKWAAIISYGIAIPIGIFLVVYMGLEYILSIIITFFAVVNYTYEGAITGGLILFNGFSMLFIPFYLLMNKNINKYFEKVRN